MISEKKHTFESDDESANSGIDVGSQRAGQGDRAAGWVRLDALIHSPDEGAD